MPTSGTVRADRDKPQALAPTAEVAQVLGIPEHTLDVWRSRGIGPAYVKIGRHVRYRWSAVNEWLESREVQNPGAA